VERGALWAFAPVLAVLPFTLLTLAVIWWVVQLAVDVPYWWFVAGYLALGLLLFVRPVQVLLLTPVLGARSPTPAESALIRPLWAEIAEANGLPEDRYVVRVLPSDELNAFACGGHLVVVTTFAIDELELDELRGVLAHELSHHLGLHTVAITLGHWLSAPIVMLARLGFYLHNVAQAAADTFGQRSPVLEFVGDAAARLLTAISWVLTAALRAGDALANIVGHSSEFDADQRAVRMGFGRELSDALRRVIAAGGGARPIGWRARLAASHPPARTRVARIEALMRHPAQ
jgi:Zn-dependent protease with chaperone function